MYKRRTQHFYDQPWFWDSMIVLLLIVSGMASIVSAYGLMHLHEPIAIAECAIVFLVMSVGFALTFYGSYIEPHRLMINRQRLEIPNAPRLRIAIASDFHLGPYKKSAFVERVVKKINALKPDLIFLVGDFIDNERSNITELDPLKHLRAAKGIFAVTGNHDAGCYLDFHHHPYQTVDRTKALEDFLKPKGIRFLKNEHAIVTIERHSIAIAGVDDAFMQACSLKNALRTIPPHTPRILLSHNPDIIRDPLSAQCDLIVSGHTHGGQIRLPFFGPLGSIPTRISKKYDEGAFKLNKKCTLFITHGLGETWARARLFCPPEIVLMEMNA